MRRVLRDELRARDEGRGIVSSNPQKTEPMDFALLLVLLVTLGSMLLHGNY